MLKYSIKLNERNFFSMHKILQKIKSIPLLKKLNQFKFMPVIWWTLLVIILPYVLSAFKTPIVWRVGLLFLIINSWISFHVGSLIMRRELSRWWIWLLPILFDLVMLPHFAKYNLIFGLIYLIFEIFGLLSNRLYR